MFFLDDLNQKTWKHWRTLADQCQRRLAEQQISPGNPGTILKDVNTLLEFVGPGGIATKSRNASLPSERLPELNAKAGHPIQLSLRRPLLRDYPNLAGVFVLLRVMGLLQMRGNRLAVCPAARDLWRNLNFAEQYFALLEALLFQAQSSVLGAKPNYREEPQVFKTTTSFLGQLSERWRQFDHYESVRVLGPQGELPTWQLFAQQQLGLIEIRPGEFEERKRAAWGGRGWLVGAARLTPWGTAVTWALLDTLKKAQDKEEAQYAKINTEANEPGLEEIGLFTFDESPSEKGNCVAHPGSAEEAGAEDAPAESRSAPEFGELLPAFHSYFPEWQNVYARPSRAVSQGLHIFKVTLAGWQGGPASGAAWPYLQTSHWMDWRERSSALSSLIATTCTTSAIATNGASCGSITIRTQTKGPSRQRLPWVRLTWPSKTRCISPLTTGIIGNLRCGWNRLSPNLAGGNG
jgi:hypothetical protein